MSNKEDINLSKEDIETLKRAETILESINDIKDSSRALSRKINESYKQDVNSLKSIVDLTKSLQEKREKILTIENNINKTTTLYKRTKDIIANNEEKIVASTRKSQGITDEIRKQNELIKKKEEQYQKEIATGRMMDRNRAARIREFNAMRDVIKVKEKELRTEEGLQAGINKKINLARNLNNLQGKRLYNLGNELKSERASAREIGEKISLIKGSVEIYRKIETYLLNESREFEKIKSLVMDVAKGGLTAWLALLQASVERWKELDKAAGDFRNKTGFLISQTRELNNSVREVNVEMAQIGVGLDEAYGAASALTNQFQVIGIVTKDMIKDTAQMAANLGISVEDSAKIRSIFTSISKSSGITATQMMGAAARLAEMGGVAPSMVMRDIAQASEESLKFLSKSPVALMRAAVEARRLGTNINSLSKSARGFLNFQDSITSELTASAMVGRSLNFQAARRAAWEKDIVKSRQLALKEISKLGDFNKLDILQQEEIAKAAGMTVEEIIQQQNQTKILAALEKERPEMYKEYMAMQKKLREDEKAGTKDLVKQGEELVKRQMRQAELNKLTNAFKQIWIDISDALLPIANVIMPIIITAVRLLAIPIKLIAALVRGFFSAFDGLGKSFRSGASGAMSLEKVMVDIGSATQTIANWMEKIVETVGRLLSLFTILTLVITKSTYAAFKPFNAIDKFFRGISIGFLNMSRGTMTFAQSFSHIIRSGTILENIFGKISLLIARIRTAFNAVSIFRPLLGMFTGVSGVFGSIFKGLSAIFKFAGTFAKFLGPIGLIISAVQVILDLVGQLIDIFKSKDMNPGEKFIRGLIAIPKAIWNAIVQPFVNIIAWVLNKIWPKLGDGMIEGLASIGNMLVDAIVLPFKTAWEWISNMFVGNSPSKLGLGIVDGIKSVGSMLFDVLSSPFKKVINFVSNMFGGKYVGIGRMIIDGIKSIGGKIFDTLSSAFKKVMEFVSNIPLIGRFFGGKDASKAAIEAKTIVESKINHIVEIVNMDELKMSIDKLTEAISLLGGAAGGATPVVNVNNNTDAMIEKLDQLIDLLEGGAVAVHMDGALVSKALARTA